MALIEVVGYSFSQGLLFAIITILIGWYVVANNLISFTRYIWIILPLLSFGLSFLFLMAVNYTQCGSINFKLITSSSFFTFVSILFFLIVSYFSFFQNFIIPIIPINLQQTYGIIIATAFFIFWAGMYGGAFGYGFAQSCPSK